MHDTESLELRSVTERFDESARTLDQLSDRLQALVLAEDTQGRAARALDTSAERLRSLADEVGEIVRALAAAQGIVQETLGVAREALRNADVNHLAEQIAGVGGQVKGLTDAVTRAQADTERARAESAALREPLDAARAELQSAQVAANQAHAESASLRDDLAAVRAQLQAAQLDAHQARSEAESLRNELASARAEAEHARRTLADLQSRVASIPERVRRKAGLA